jgi:simple sugar transport system ATP-binding protein
MAHAPDAIRAEGISKQFGPVTALRGINLRLGKGEILGLIGDNGAGKSTLLKILTGFHPPDSGRILVDGQEVTLGSVSHARSLGIDTVYQDLALVKELAVYENMFLGRELAWNLFGFIPVLRRSRMREVTAEYLRGIQLRVPSIDGQVASLSGGQRQAIAVARSAFSDARILLLDEPLAAMGAREGAVILDLIRQLKARGDVSIIIIAHNYAQIVAVCDRVNLLQHGMITFDRRTDETSVEELTRLVASEYNSVSLPA